MGIDEPDALAPARGIAYGFALSVPVWALILLASVLAYRMLSGG